MKKVEKEEKQRLMKREDYQKINKKFAEKEKLTQENGLER